MKPNYETEGLFTSPIALILAGGKSSRMGRDKSLIQWEGKPIIERVCQSASTCCDRVYILTPWPERYRDILNGNYQYLPESDRGRGPLLAFAEGLNRIARDCHRGWLLLLACDLPRLETEILQNWASQLERLPAEVMALIPQQKTGWEPLCGFYRLEVESDLQNFIWQGGRSFQSWLTHLSVRPIYLDEKAAKMLWNCNSPEDLI